MSGYSLYGGSTQLTVCKNKVTTMYNLNPENNTWNTICDNYQMKEYSNVYSLNERPLVLLVFLSFWVFQCFLPQDLLWHFGVVV